MWKLIAFEKDEVQKSLFQLYLQGWCSDFDFLPAKEDEGQNVNSTIINIMILIIIILHFYNTFHVRDLQ